MRNNIIADYKEWSFEFLTFAYKCTVKTATLRKFQVLHKSEFGGAEMKIFKYTSYSQNCRIISSFTAVDQLMRKKAGHLMVYSNVRLRVDIVFVGGRDIDHK